MIIDNLFVHNREGRCKRNNDSLNESCEYALVVGASHANTLGVIEALGQKGIFSIVVIYPRVKDSFVLSSKYVKDGWICSTEKEVVDSIKHKSFPKRNKIVAIACSDDTANILDSHFEELDKKVIIPTINEPGKLINWTDKVRMTCFAKELGINTPTSWSMVGKIVPNDIIYPCVIKPINSVNHGKKGFAKCYNKEELQAYIDARQEWEPIQIQQFIEKDFEFQFIGCSLNAGEEVIIPGRTHIETTTGFNNLVFLRYDHYDLSFEKTVYDSKRFVKETGYSGLFSIEFMRGKDGNDYFLEMNFRNDGNGIAVTSSGTNLPYIWYLFASGGDYKTEIAKSKVKTTYMMPEISFLMSVFNGEVSFKEWLADRRKTTCHLTRFEDDMEPYRMMMRDNRKTIIQGLFLFSLRKLHLFNVVKKVKRFIVK